MTPPAELVEGTDTRVCGCCGREFPARRVAELGHTPDVYICAGCAYWAARRAGRFSALRQIRLRALLARFAGRAREPHLAKTAVPILPSGDLDRTEAFYLRTGLADARRYDDNYLLVSLDGVELHFARQDVVTPGVCFLHVVDATKVWKRLRHQGIDGVGDIADQDYGLREFVLTDPDGNRIRFGSPRP